MEVDPGSAPVGRVVARNFLYLFSAQVVGRLAGLASMAWLARFLGPQAFGILGFGTAVIAFFGHGVALGSEVYGAREIARRPADAARLVSGIAGLRLVTAAVAVAAFLAVVWLIDQSGTVKTVMIIQGTGLIVITFSLDFVFQGLQRMEIIAARQAAASLLALAAVVALIRGPDDVFVAAAIPVAATAVTAVWLLGRVRRRIGGIGVRLALGEARGLVRGVLPLAVSGAMSTIYYNTDIVMLGFLADHRAVGLYVGAYRIFVVGLVVGSLIGTAFAPALAAAWRDRGSRESGFREFAGVMFFAGMPIAAAGIAFPREAMVLVFGDAFGAAGGAFVILMAAIAFAYATTTGGVCLIAWSDQTAHVLILTVGAAANVIANLALIPAFGIVGAASATLTCQGFVAFAVFVRIHRRFVAVEAARLARPVICAAVAFAIARLLYEVAAPLVPGLSGGAAFVLSAAAGGALYLGLAVAFGAVDLGRLRSVLVGRAPGG